MPVNSSDDKFLEALLSLGFDDFATLKCVHKSLTGAKPNKYGEN